MTNFQKNAADYFNAMKEKRDEQILKNSNKLRTPAKNGFLKITKKGDKMVVGTAGISGLGYVDIKPTYKVNECMKVSKLSDLEIKRANLDNQVFDKNWREVVSVAMFDKLLLGVC